MKICIVVCQPDQHCRPSNLLIIAVNIIGPSLPKPAELDSVQYSFMPIFLGCLTGINKTLYSTKSYLGLIELLTTSTL